MQPAIRGRESQHVIAWHRHRIAKALAMLRHVRTYAGHAVRTARAPEMVECNRRNAAEWRQIAEFLSFDPRPGGGSASAPGARS